MNRHKRAHQLTTEIAAAYSRLSAVESVVLAGSQTTVYAGPTSDIDLYVYQRTSIAIDDRRAIATASSSKSEVNNQFWETGDEWIDKATGIHVDVMFRMPAWIEDQLDRVLVRHEASLGYSTCFWYNVLTSQILFDRNGWFDALQQRANQPYPDTLLNRIIEKNYAVLRRSMSAYHSQIVKAVKRKDWVSVNHRVSALLASYFDIIFALNRLPHPGEKRLVEIAVAECTLLPADMYEQVNVMLEAGAGQGDVLRALDGLLNPLEVLLKTRGLLSG
ncbi:MAG: DUF4037 domain-containing protein [Bacteroidota bacterium]